MLTPRLRDRLSRLARGLAAEPASAVSPSGSPDALAATAPPALPPQPWFLHYDPRECGAERECPVGACFVVEPELGALLPDHEARVQAWQRLPEPEWGEREGRLFLDIETAGLSAAPLFLIGTLALEGNVLRLRQFLARDYTEEAPLLRSFFEWGKRYPRLVTFNGRAFDLPYLLDRAIYHRLAGGIGQEHTDLLPLARRRWRHEAPDCRLATLESHLYGRCRVGDVDGAEIPQLYHSFVRTPNWELLAPVLHHNALDLLTMSDLAARLAG
jgi:hypothetical protein